VLEGVEYEWLRYRLGVSLSLLKRDMTFRNCLGWSGLALLR
jgi:hypothetical protein